MIHVPTVQCRIVLDLESSTRFFILPYSCIIMIDLLVVSWPGRSSSARGGPTDAKLHGRPRRGARGRRRIGSPAAAIRYERRTTTDVLELWYMCM